MSITSITDLSIESGRRQARVGVIGLGYVGLPLAVEFARAGFDVTGFDVDAARSTQINAGKSYIPDVTDAGAGRRASTPGGSRATTDMSQLGAHGRHRHLRADAAAQDQGSRSVVRRAGGRSGGRHAQRRASSSSSSRRPIRGRPTKSCSRCSRPAGSKADVDFFLAFSPERVDPGNRQYHDQEHPKDRRRRRRREHRGGRRACTARSSRPWCRSARRGSPRWSSCSRTRSAR